jgi:hypothetical protein
VRNFPSGKSLVIAALCICSSAASAQTKKPNDSAAPASFDPHDLSGLWNQNNPRNASVFERYWVYEFTKEAPPMTAWGQAQFNAAKSSFGAHTYPLAEVNDPLYHDCTPPGLPRVYLHPFPMEIVQTPGEVLVLFEFDSLRHPIYVDGRKHDEALGPQWMGDSIGHWEGNTLVADTLNFNDKTWIDRVGHPHSAELHLVERFKRTDQDHLALDITIEDPKAYTRPWTAHLDFVLRPTWTLGEQFCEDEHSFESFDKGEAPPNPAK